MLNKILVYFWLTGIFISPVFGQEFGSAVINSVPDSADVYIDGYWFGKTPFEPVFMIPGKYLLTLKLNGYDSLTTVFEIERGRCYSKSLYLVQSADTIKQDLAEADSAIVKGKDNRKNNSKRKYNSNYDTELIYPDLARQYGIEGKAIIQILIGFEGLPEMAFLAQSSGAFCLDYEALRYAMAREFKPPVCDGGKVVKVWVMCPVTFKYR